MRENQKVRASGGDGLTLPLAGVAIGDGWVDPVRQIDAYPEMMFGQGMISTSQKMTIRDYCDRTIEAIERGDMVGAFDVWDKMLNGDIWPYANLFHNMTGSNDYDNMMVRAKHTFPFCFEDSNENPKHNNVCARYTNSSLQNTNAPASFNYYSKYVNLPAVRKMIHVGDAKFPFVRRHESWLTAEPLPQCLPQSRWHFATGARHSVGSINDSSGQSHLQRLPSYSLCVGQNPRACEMNLLADFMVSFQVRAKLHALRLPYQRRHELSSMRVTGRTHVAALQHASVALFRPTRYHYRSSHH